MDIVTLITSAAKAASIAPTLLLAVCHTETGLHNVVSPHDGHSASYGVCQVKLATAREIEPKTRAMDLMRPSVNVRIAAKYLAKQIRRYGGRVHCGVAAYNAGSVRYCPRIDNNYNNGYFKKVSRKLREIAWTRQNY